MTLIIAFRVLDFFFKLFSQVCFVFDFVFFNVDSADFFFFFVIIRVSGASVLTRIAPSQRLTSYLILT